MNQTEINALKKYCKSTFSLNAIQMPADYHNLPLCVTDAVFSLGIKYQITENVVKRVATHFKTPITRTELLPIREDQLSVSKFIETCEAMSIDQLTNQLFANRNRTSPRNGILKSEASVQFCRVLKKNGVDYLQDIDQILGKSDFENDILHIRGQGSGISLKYFYMLVGNDHFVKPDRMIVRFISKVLNRTVDVQECQPILKAVCESLVAHYPELTMKKLDYAIWQYQRSMPSS